MPKLNEPQARVLRRLCEEEQTATYSIFVDRWQWYHGKMSHADNDVLQTLHYTAYLQFVPERSHDGIAEYVISDAGREALAAWEK